MAAPQIMFSVDSTQITANGHAIVTVTSDMAVAEFKAMAVEYEDSGTYGPDVGEEVASLEAFLADVPQTFTIDGADLDEGRYMIFLWAKSADTQTWNDDAVFLTSSSDGVITADLKTFNCVRS